MRVRPLLAGNKFPASTARIKFGSRMNIVIILIIESESQRISHNTLLNYNSFEIHTCIDFVNNALFLLSCLIRNFFDD